MERDIAEVAGPGVGPADPKAAEAVRRVENGRLRQALDGRIGGLPAPFWWLWLGTLVNRAGTFIEPFLVLYLTGPRHLSVQTAGAVVTAWGVGSIICAPLAGWLTDHVGRRFTLGLGLFGTALALGGLGLARGVALITVASFLVGVIGDVYRPAASATIADLLSGEQRTRAFALQFWAINLGFSVATLSAGLLARASFSLLFLFDALTCAAFGLLVLAKVPESRPTVEQDSGPAAWRVLAADRLFQLAFLLALAYATLYSQIYLSLPLAVRDAGLSPASYGLIMSVNGIAIVVLQPIALPWIARMSRRLLLPASMLLVGGGISLAALCTATWQFALTVLVWTVGEIGQSTALMALVADLAPEALRGRYLGAFGLAWGTSGVLGPLLGSTLYAASPGLLWLTCLGIGIGGAAGHLVLTARLAASPAR